MKSNSRELPHMTSRLRTSNVHHHSEPYTHLNPSLMNHSLWDLKHPSRSPPGLPPPPRPGRPDPEDERTELWAACRVLPEDLIVQLNRYMLGVGEDGLPDAFVAPGPDQGVFVLRPRGDGPCFRLRAVELLLDVRRRGGSVKVGAVSS